MIRQLCFPARQERKERATYPNFALQPDSAALSLHDPFRERQTESRTLKLLRDTGVELMELLKQVLLVLL